MKSFLKSLFDKNVDMFSQSNLEFLERTWKGFALVLNVLKTDVIVKTGVWCLSKEKKDFSKKLPNINGHVELSFR